MRRKPNFEIEVIIDGHWRKFKLAPKKSDGGFQIRIRQLDGTGYHSGADYHPTPIELTGVATPDGMLHVNMYHREMHFKKTTPRDPTPRTP